MWAVGFYVLTSSSPCRWLKDYLTHVKDIINMHSCTFNSVLWWFIVEYCSLSSQLRWISSRYTFLYLQYSLQLGRLHLLLECSHEWNFVISVINIQNILVSILWWQVPYVYDIHIVNMKSYYHCHHTKIICIPSHYLLYQC